MKRGAPLRRTGIRRGTPIRTRRAQGIPTAVRERVHARAQGLCEWPSCTSAGTELHHRLMRSQGGKHTVSNLALLCRHHHQVVHLNPADSYATGWLIRSTQGEPA